MTENKLRKLIEDGGDKYIMFKANISNEKRGIELTDFPVQYIIFITPSVAYYDIFDPPVKFTGSKNSDTIYIDLKHLCKLLISGDPLAMEIIINAEDVHEGIAPLVDSNVMFNTVALVNKLINTVEILSKKGLDYMETYSKEVNDIILPKYKDYLTLYTTSGKYTYDKYIVSKGYFNIAKLKNSTNEYAFKQVHSYEGSDIHMFKTDDNRFNLYTSPPLNSQATGILIFDEEAYIKDKKKADLRIKNKSSFLFEDADNIPDIIQHLYAEASMYVSWIYTLTNFSDSFKATLDGIDLNTINRCLEGNKPSVYTYSFKKMLDNIKNYREDLSECTNLIEGIDIRVINVLISQAYQKVFVEPF